MYMLYFMLGRVEHETGHKYGLTVMRGASFVLLLVQGLCLDQVQRYAVWSHTFLEM